MSAGVDAADDLVIHRLSDLDEWEFYRVVPSPKDDAPFTIALRPYAELREVEYEVWDETADEPRRTGSVACDDVGEGWSTAVRAPVVRRIVAALRSEG